MTIEILDANENAIVLGLNDDGPARKLARVLLADPLAAEGAWEKRIEVVGKDDGRGLLIR